MKASSHRRSARFFGHGVVAATLLGAAAAASAGERGWYLGTMVDNTSVSVASDAYNSESGPGSTGYALRGGLRLNNHVAVDFGLQRNSDLKWTEPFADVPDVPGFYDSQVVFDARVAQASVVGILPFARVFEAYARGGIEYYALNGEQYLTDLLGGPSVSRPVSSNGTGYVMGFGVGATVAKTWHVNLELQSLRISRTYLGVPSGNFAWLDSWGVGIERRFGRGQSGGVEER